MALDSVAKVMTNPETPVESSLAGSYPLLTMMAVAVAGEKSFGAGESTITARLPLMVRPSPPRFLNFGDSFELPVIVQNQTGAAMDVDVVVRRALVYAVTTIAIAMPAMPK